MAHDRMDDDRERNMGSAGEKDDQNFGQQSPGRNPQQGQQGQQGGQKGAGQKNPLEDDDEFGGGQSGKGQSGQGGAHEGRMGGQKQ